MKKTVSLVLGSGGARGITHIGVIRYLEENGYTIKSISGSSMGALVGGIYCTGELADFEKWLRSITKLDIVRLLDLSWHKSGLVKGDKIINTIKELTGDTCIEDLDRSFTAVAVDFKAEKEVWLDSGPLFDAIRASISLPLFFTPYKRGETLLIDGGVLNPVPIAPTFSDDTDLTIAVSLNGRGQDRMSRKKKGKEQETLTSGLEKKVAAFIKKLQNGREDDTSDIDWGAYDIAAQAFDAMQGTITRQKLAAYPPDIHIEFPRSICNILEFDRADELIELGYETARRFMEQKG